MSDLIAFITARLDDDEQTARAATGGTWMVGPTFGARDSRVYVTFEDAGIDTIGTCVIAGQVANMPEFRANAAHIARHDPARVLREVEAKRRVLARHCRDERNCCEGCGFTGDLDDPRTSADEDCPELADMAAVWADHPSYQAEWAP